MTKKFTDFMQVIEQRLEKQGIMLNESIIDHVCYRTADEKDLRDVIVYWSGKSLLYCKSFFHERDFYVFLLKEPLVYKDHQVSYLELPAPGGRHTYEMGFQHIELLTNDRSIEVDKNRYGKKEIKWEDNLAVKFTAESLFAKSSQEEGSMLVVL